MQRADPKKTKSARKGPWWVRVLPLGAALVVLAVSLLVSAGHNGSARHNKTGPNVRLGGKQYALEVADTPSAQEKGLGDRNAMPADLGMIFTFPVEGRQCFWMKDMRFSLDIVWVDSSKHVSNIERDLSPATYPNEYCGTAKDVIELNAGVTTQAMLHIGDTIDY